MLCDMIKNNPFFIRYSRYNSYEGLDIKRPSDSGFCRFVDIHYAVLACARLFMKNYRCLGFVTVKSCLNAFGRLSTYQCLRITMLPTDVLDTEFKYAQLIYEVVSVMVDQSYIERHNISVDFIYGVIKSHKLFIS